MPELPEIETVRLQLQKVLPGKVIENIEVLNSKSFQGNPKLIIGKRILGVGRKAKLLLIDMEGEADLAIHFKMTGQLVWVPDEKSQIQNSNNQINSNYQNINLKIRIVGGHPTADFTGELPSKHTRVIFHLKGGKLYFNDQRIFGWVEIINSKIKSQKSKAWKYLNKLGPEPFDIDEDEFLKLLWKLKRPIKLALMDQTIISGVGNIYANDACWEAKINPRRLANTLTAKQYRELYLGVKKVLEEGIRYGGATAADAKYINLHGLGGHYQEHFRVYDREGEECLREDEGIIHRYALGGRGTYFCPKCQK